MLERLTLRHLMLAFLCIGIGAGLTAAGLRVTGEELLPAGKWDPAQAGLSNYEEVRIWGWPLYWVIDHPSRGTVGQMDLPAEVHAGPLGVVWSFLSLGVAHLLALAWLLLGRRAGFSLRPDGPATPSLLLAAVVAPFSTFWIVHLMLPIVMLLIEPIGWPGLSHDLRFAAAMAVYATCAAYAVMFVLGLPICFRLRRGGRFRLGTLAWIGALAGAAPFLYGVVASIPSMFAGGEAGATEGWIVTLLLAMSGGSGLASASMLWLVAAKASV